VSHVVIAAAAAVVNIRHINTWVCRIYCHKVIKLSDAVQQLPRQETMFVHGVSPTFLQVGEAKAAAAAQGQQVWNKVSSTCGQLGRGSLGVVWLQMQMRTEGAAAFSGVCVGGGGQDCGAWLAEYS